MRKIATTHVCTLVALAAAVVSFDAQAIPTPLLIATSTQGAGNTANIYAGNYNGTTPVGASWSSDPLVVPPPGNVSGVYQSPFNNTPLLDTQSFFSVGAESGTNGAPSPVSLTFGSLQDAFSLLWGSIDSYNTLQFYQGGTQLLSLTGTDVVSQFGLGGSSQNYEQVALLSFSFGANELFDTVKFISTQAAFEFALPAPRPVPEPGTLALLGIGLIGAHFLRRRRKS